MSRLQKKKPAVEKKKKKEAKKSVTSDENVSSARQTAVSNLPKSKPEGQTVASKDKKDKKDNFVGTATEFLREVKVELKKVTWPTRKQTTGTTIVVIIFVFILAVFLGIFDYSLSRLVQVVLT
ncbi:MAG: preprotein translocase subunit SecE [Desulfotignum sp.]